MLLSTLSNINNLDATNRIKGAVSNTRELKTTHRDTRLNVIILTHMSSGSTFVGNIFNLHPDVFYLLEPLRELRMVHYGEQNMGEWNDLDRKAKHAYSIDSKNLLRDIFTCSFQGNGTLDNVFFGWLRKKAQLDFLAWRSPTTQFTKDAIRQVCNSRRITVAKIMQTRLLGEIGIRELQRVCKSGPGHFECLIIHLVRDPRAVLSSLIRRNFFIPNAAIRELITLVNTTGEGKAIIRHNARRLCSQVEHNLDYVNKEWPNWFKARYILVRYEDTVSDLSRVVLFMYNFTGLPLVSSISKWIYKGVSPVRSRNFDAFIISKEDISRADEWRFHLHISLVSEFEKTCARLMKQMGYIPISGSERLLLNASQKLWTAKIPVLESLES